MLKYIASAALIAVASGQATMTNPLTAFDVAEDHSRFEAGSDHAAMGAEIAKPETVRYSQTVWDSGVPAGPIDSP